MSLARSFLLAGLPVRRGWFCREAQLCFIFATCWELLVAKDCLRDVASSLLYANLICSEGEEPGSVHFGFFAGFFCLAFVRVLRGLCS